MRIGLGMEMDNLILVVLLVGALITIYGLWVERLRWIVVGLCVFMLGIALFFYYMLKM